MIWCLNGHMWVWDYRTSTKSFAKITPKTYHFFNWPKCRPSCVCVDACACQLVWWWCCERSHDGYPSIPWHTHTKAIWPSLSPCMPPLWFGCSSFTFRGFIWTEEDDDDRRMEKTEQEEARDVEGETRQRGDTRSHLVFGRCLVSRWPELEEGRVLSSRPFTNHTALPWGARESPFNGNQWELLHERKGWMGGGARDLSLCCPPPLRVTALAHGYKRACAVISTHMRSRNNFD